MSTASRVLSRTWSKLRAGINLMSTGLANTNIRRDLYTINANANANISEFYKLYSCRPLISRGMERCYLRLYIV